MDRSQARSELAGRGIEFTADVFVKEAEWGKLEIVKLFVAAGMSVDAVGGEYGGTALHEAAGQDRLAVVQYLVSQGASVRARDDYGYTPRGRAHKAGHRAVVAYFDSLDDDDDE